MTKVNCTHRRCRFCENDICTAPEIKLEYQNADKTEFCLTQEPRL